MIITIEAQKTNTSKIHKNHWKITEKHWKSGFISGSTDQLVCDGMIHQYSKIAKFQNMISIWYAFQVKKSQGFATMFKKPWIMDHFQKYLYFMEKVGPYVLSHCHHVIEHPFLYRTALMWKKIRSTFGKYRPQNVPGSPKKSRRKTLNFEISKDSAKFLPNHHVLGQNNLYATQHNKFYLVIIYIYIHIYYQNLHPMNNQISTI